MSDKSSLILLVEDNAGDVYLFRRALQSAQVKCELMVMPDGAEAMCFVRGEGKYAGSAMPDLVVLDLNLPKKSGLEVLTAIRESGDFASVPVAILSSSASQQDVARTRQLGANWHITKPAELDEFLRIGEVFRGMLGSHG